MRQVNGSMIYRAAKFLPKTVSEEERTVDLVWTTGSRVLRVPWFDEPYFEELAVEDSSVRLQRLNGGAPLLDSHESRNLSDQIGVVLRSWIKGGKGHATVQFRSNAKSQEIFQDVKSGILRNISVGYVVHETVETREKDAKYATLRAVDWEPYEISLVPIPADPGAQIRSAEKFPIKLRSESLPKEVVTESKPEANQIPLETEKPLDLDKIRSDVLADERKRASEIELMCRKARLSELSSQLISEGVSIEEARRRVFEKLVENDPGETRSHVRIQAGELDENRTRREAMRDALLHRYQPTSYALGEPARRYRGMSLSEMVRASLGSKAEGLSKRELAVRAFHSTSDFPEILANVARQSLLDSYERLIQRQNFQPLVRITEAPDFKPMRKVRLGEIPSLKLVPEGAEVTSGTIGEGAEEYAIATYARKFSLTRQTIINDDLNAFTDLPAKWGVAAARLENILFWSIFSVNQRMSDGVPLFHEKHGNVSKEAGSISEDTLSAAELAMSEQTGIDKRDKLNIVPKYLIVPSTLKTAAKKAIMLPIVPTNTDDANPFAGEYTVISEPMLNASSPTAWYMAADLDSGVDLVEMAYLDGIRQPQVEFREGFDVFGVDIRASLDVGARALDYRGFYKNEGAK